MQFRPSALIFLLANVAWSTGFPVATSHQASNVGAIGIPAQENILQERSARFAIGGGGGFGGFGPSAGRLGSSGNGGGRGGGEGILSKIQFGESGTHAM
ncbi:hypothetical protein BXZ70DRAFT_1009458 [Cristinia sonorae]|uniref:Glycine-rich protein n=1 Tax=Cristinia sonorae TaxID=1940300 RepID=A0A8K0XNE9_9AGAR|nr:hypothetical protein BXZ70DRAFT_1009458 [Cristinia sonorae]